ncbi:hypothetical protein PUN28_019849 [Cardiocondyla obscurior]|uniref:Uncharacterized protein n=1 Tax=Cardiocondyla obscurior TaxID=286306 RepID=A0AAW2EBP6_9HYME
MSSLGEGLRTLGRHFVGHPLYTTIFICEDTPAFMPHYHRFETRHGRADELFYCSIIGSAACRAGLAKVAARIPTKSRRPGFIHEKLSLNLKGRPSPLSPLEYLVNVAAWTRYWPRSEEFRLERN